MVVDFQGKSREDKRELEVARRREIIFGRTGSWEEVRDYLGFAAGLHFRGRVIKFDAF